VEAMLDNVAHKELVILGFLILVSGLILIGYSAVVTSIPTFVNVPKTQTLEDTYLYGYNYAGFYAAQGHQVTIIVTPNNTANVSLMDSDNHLNYIMTKPYHAIYNTTLEPNQTLTLRFTPTKSDIYYIHIEAETYTLTHIKATETTLTLQLILLPQNNSAAFAAGAILVFISPIPLILGAVGLEKLKRKPKPPTGPQKWAPRNGT